MSHYLKYASIAIIAAGLVFQSCKTNENKKSGSLPQVSNSINAQVPAVEGSQDSNNVASFQFGNLSQQLADTLARIGQRLQVKEIDPTTDNVIVGNSGTRIIIAANSILNEKGLPANSKVKVELKENYSFSDFITANLQTISNGQLLQTQGMIYFNARDENGYTLKINPQKPIRIEFPVDKSVAGVQLFKGQRDKEGKMNWDLVGNPAKTLIPFPIRAVAPQGFGECSKNYGITSDRKYYNENRGEIYLTLDTLDKYENTLLATREFKERYYVYCMPELTRIYIHNLDKNMWEIDEMMVQFFIKDSTERVDYWKNNPPKGLNGQPATEDQKKAVQSLTANDKEYDHRLIEIFKSFAAERLTKIDASRKVNISAIKEASTAFVAYDALQFGWANVDCLYNDPRAEKIKLITKTNTDAYLVNLILPAEKIILTGIKKGDNTYSFTKEQEGYNKLLKGERGVIVCISIVDNQLYFAEKKILIGENEVETLELVQTNGETVKAKLKSYGR